MRRITLVLAVFLAACSAAVGQPARSADAGRLTDKRGLVTYRKAGAERFGPAAVGATLSVGDFIATDFDSEATIGFPDGTQARMLEMSQVRVNEIFLAGDLPRLELYLRLGQVETLSPPAAAGRTGFSIATPTATAWIRGTHQLVAQAEGFGTRIDFLEGFGFTASRDGRGVEQDALEKSAVAMDLKLTGPELFSRYESVPKLSPHGRDADEVSASRDFDRLTIAPPRDATNPYAQGDLAGRHDLGDLQSRGSPTSQTFDQGRVIP